MFSQYIADVSAPLLDGIGLHLSMEHVLYETGAWQAKPNMSTLSGFRAFSHLPNVLDNEVQVVDVSGLLRDSGPVTRDDGLPHLHLGR